VSDKLLPSFIPHINTVMSRRSMIATLTHPDGISISKFIDALTSNFLTFQVDTTASRDLWTSRSRASMILHLKIHRANDISVTLKQHNTPDAVVVEWAM